MRDEDERPSRRWLAAPLVVLAAVAGILIGVMQARNTACAATLPVPAAAGLVTGQATFYTLQGGGGNCSYPGPPANRLYAAVSPAEYAKAAACGGMLDVAGPLGTVRVTVIDQCPECKLGHIDLSAEAFARIAKPSDGLVPVTYTVVRNPAPAGDLAFRIQEGASQYWFSLLVINNGNPLAKVEVHGPSGGWLNLTRADYNYWIYEPGAGPGPFSVRVTDVLGNVAVAGGIRLAPGAVQHSGQYLAGSGAPVITTTKTPAGTSSAPRTTSSTVSSTTTTISVPSSSPWSIPLTTSSSSVLADGVVTAPCH